jgi:hypothetical protein
VGGVEMIPQNIFNFNNINRIVPFYASGCKKSLQLVIFAFIFE